MRSLSLALAILMLTAGCGGSSSDQPPSDDHLVASGQYTLDAVDAQGFGLSDFGALTMDVNVSALTATLTQQDGSTVPLTLTPVPHDQWSKCCPATNANGNSYSYFESYTVSPDPTVVTATTGALNIPGPILTTYLGASGSLRLEAAEGNRPMLEFKP